jgi:hypothetical protein
MQSVYITTNVVSSNPAHGEVYSIQHYVIKFVSDFRQIGGFTHRVKSTLRSRVKWQSKTMTLKDAPHWYFKKQIIII